MNRDLSDNTDQFFSCLCMSHHTRKKWDFLYSDVYLEEKTVRSITYFFTEIAVKWVLPHEKRNQMRQKNCVNQYIIRSSILVHSTQKEVLKQSSKPLLETALSSSPKNGETRMFFQSLWPLNSMQKNSRKTTEPFLKKLVIDRQKR